MWRLKAPHARQAQREVVTALTSNGRLVHPLPIARRQAIASLYAQYDRRRGRPDPTLKGVGFPQAFLAAMHDAYDQVQESGRLSQLRTRLKLGATKCPYCGFGEIYSLDHHLPRSKYELLAIYAKNLVPCCHVCNHKKRALASDDPNEHIAHVYLDAFPRGRFLVAQIAAGKDRFRATFQIRRCSGMSAELFARLKFQLDRFALNARYQAEVNDLLVSHQLSIESNATTPRRLRRFLRSTRDSFRASYGLNHWRTALFHALAQSDDFISGGYRNCFPKRRPGA
jgi:hypothetical protein